MLNEAQDLIIMSLKWTFGVWTYYNLEKDVHEIITYT